jgi:multidrug efflux pump
VSIGIVITFGMLVGTLFTLFVVPVIYSYVARRHVPATETGFAARLEAS